MQLNVILSASMPLALAQKVQEAVKKRDTSVSAWLREAVERHLSENKTNIKERRSLRGE